MAAAYPALGRSESASQYLWVFAALGLVGFGVASGMAIAFGETAAFYITLSAILAAAILFDFRLARWC